jgi:hypothetical protein
MRDKDRPVRPGPGTNVHRLRKLSGNAAQVSGREYPYSDEERDKAVAKAAELGIPKAAELLGMSQSTLANMVSKAKRDQRAALQEFVQSGGTLEEAFGPAPSWREVRLFEADRQGQTAGLVREQMVQAVLSGNDRMLRAAAIAIDVLIRSAQAILASEPQRHPRDQSPEEHERRVAQIQESARERVAAKVKAEAEAAGLDPEEVS